jgi:hypothetical protein
MLPETPGTGAPAPAVGKPYYVRCESVCCGCDCLVFSQVGQNCHTMCMNAFEYDELPEDCPRYMETIVMTQGRQERPPDR